MVTYSDQSAVLLSSLQEFFLEETKLNAQLFSSIGEYYDKSTIDGDIEIVNTMGGHDVGTLGAGVD